MNIYRNLYTEGIQVDFSPPCSCIEYWVATNNLHNTIRHKPVIHYALYKQKKSFTLCSILYFN